MKSVLGNEIYLIGDLHGNYTTFFNYVDRLDLKNCTVICVGDFGIGFGGSHICGSNLTNWDTLKLFAQSIEARNIRFMSIRGNHDNPAFWDPNNKHRKNLFTDHNILLIPDYTELEDSYSNKWFFVGGAVSIDRSYRKEGTDWWSDEVVQHSTSTLPNCDVLVTHTAPGMLASPINAVTGTSIYKLSQQYRDNNLLEHVDRERVILNNVYNTVLPKRAYMGHFHISLTTDVQLKDKQCTVKVLNINELTKHEV